MARLGTSLRHAWNVFANQEDRRKAAPIERGGSYGRRPDRNRLYISNERSIISSIFTRLSIDVAGVDVRHVRLDDQNRYIDDMDSGLNDCLTLAANIDQAATHFRQDIAMTLFDKGVLAIVPVDTTINPEGSGGYDIVTLRVGEITGWFANSVRVNLFNEAKQIREEITISKSAVAIVENPLYAVMNETNSTLQRLIHKLNLLDSVDEASASGKLDIIVQLPYTVKTETKRQQAQQRRDDIEFQLKGSQYGIAYIDGTEKVTQLNRPAENNLMAQVEYLTNMLYGQLGLTEEVMNGTADEATMLNYWNRTIEPVLTAIVEAMRRSFLTKTARTQKQSIMFFKDPFAFVPIGSIAEIVDKFTRNEVGTSNEMRQIIGWKPHPDPKADQLINSNMPINKATGIAPQPQNNPGTDILASSFDQIDTAIDDAFAEFGG